MPSISFCTMPEKMTVLGTGSTASHHEQSFCSSPWGALKISDMTLPRCSSWQQAILRLASTVAKKSLVLFASFAENPTSSMPCMTAILIGLEWKAALLGDHKPWTPWPRASLWVFLLNFQKEEYTSFCCCRYYNCSYPSSKPGSIVMDYDKMRQLLWSKLVTLPISKGEPVPSSTWLLTWLSMDRERGDYLFLTCIASNMMIDFLRSNEK